MVNIDMLKRQHEDISSVITGLRGIIQQRCPESNAASIANQINILAGKLRIHLNTEDEFMYPSLLNNVSSELKDIAKRYIDEMGSISKKFLVYKNNYNTKTKIISDMTGFLKSTDTILKILEDRIEKENKILYPLLKL